MNQMSSPNWITEGDRFGHIEARGIDYIPHAERHGHARELFLVLMAPNIIYLDIIPRRRDDQARPEHLAGYRRDRGGERVLAPGGPRFGERVAIRNARRRCDAGHVRGACKSGQYRRLCLGR